ncbi:MAG: substrate-binding domain-containing protein, partial [Myxococcota bacterium]
MLRRFLRRSTMPRFGNSLWALGCCVLAAGCDPQSHPSELRVFAASSLTDALQELGIEFGREHPTLSVRSAFAGSQVLRLQVEQGAVGDIFASANEDHMEALVAEG